MSVITKTQRGMIDFMLRRVPAGPAPLHSFGEADIDSRRPELPPLSTPNPPIVHDSSCSFSETESSGIWTGNISRTPSGAFSSSYAWQQRTKNVYYDILYRNSAQKLKKNQEVEYLGRDKLLKKFITKLISQSFWVIH